MATPLSTKEQQCIPFNLFSPNHGKASKNKIKTVVVDKFIHLYEADGTSLKNSAEFRRCVIGQLFGKQSYIINQMNHPPGDDEIVNWFISGKHGAKLHRRSIIQQNHKLEAILRNAGVNLDHPCEATGDTPLILAARYHYADTVKALIDSGANISIKNHNKRDAIHETVQSMNDDNYSSTPLFETVKHLINNGADVSQEYNGADVPEELDYAHQALSTFAVTRTQARTAELFITAPNHGLEYMAMFNLAKGKRRDNPKTLGLIYEKTRPKDEPRNYQGMTPLMLASYYQNPECLKVILQQPKTDIEATTIRDVEGFNKKFTAYSFSSRNSECAAILEAYGAKKIRPKLADIERQWLNDLIEAINARDLSVGFGASFSRFLPFVTRRELIRIRSA